MAGPLHFSLTARYSATDPAPWYENSDGSNRFSFRSASVRHIPPVILPTTMASGGPSPWAMASSAAIRASWCVLGGPVGDKVAVTSPTGKKRSSAVGKRVSLRMPVSPPTRASQFRDTPFANGVINPMPAIKARMSVKRSPLAPFPEYGWPVFSN